jgi:hypothetical protein
MLAAQHVRSWREASYSLGAKAGADSWDLEVLEGTLTLRQVVQVYTLATNACKDEYSTHMEGGQLQTPVLSRYRYRAYNALPVLPSSRLCCLFLTQQQCAPAIPPIVS